MIQLYHIFIEVDKKRNGRENIEQNNLALGDDEKGDREYIETTRERVINERKKGIFRLFLTVILT
jgi:hypothetical protein